MTISAAITATSISFTSANYTLTGSSANPLTLGYIGQIDVASGVTVTISAPLLLASGLTKTNTGILTLSGTVSGTAAATMNVATGSVNVSTSESWQTVTLGTAGTLVMSGSGTGLVASGSITVDGSFDHEGGSVQTPTLTVDSTGTFRDGSGSLAGSVSNITISNAGKFISVTSQSLNGSTGSLTNTGTYEADNSGGGTTTLGLSFTDNNGTINVSGGTLSVSAISLPTLSTMTLIGSGTLDVPYIDDDGAAIVQNSGTLNVAGSLAIGDHGGTTASYTLTAGTLSAAYISVGAYSTASFIQTGGTVNDSGQFQLGEYGNGTYLQSGGNSNFYRLYVGLGGNGTYNLSGGTCTVPTLDLGDAGTGLFLLSGSAVLSSTSSESIGEGGGYGSLIQSGTSNNSMGNFAIGGASSIYNLFGGTFTCNWMAIGTGGNSIGTFVQSAGTALVSYAITIGSGSSSSGTYLISGGVLASGYNVNIGSSGGNGSFDETGGTVSFPNGSLVLGASASSATINLSGGSLYVSGYTFVGYSSPATFIQSGGTFTNNSDLFIGGDDWGVNTSAVGTYFLSGTGQLNTARTIIGFTADGTFTQTGGSHTTSNLIENGLAGTVGIYNQTGGTLSATTTTDVQKPSATGPSAVNEGSLYTLNLSAFSPVYWWSYIDGWNVAWGDGNTSNLSGNPSSATHTYYVGSVTDTINAEATHSGETYQTAPLNVFVNDVPASIANISNQSINTGSPLTISTPFTDPGINETHTGVINWGDGTSSFATINESNGSGSISGSHVYGTHGNYNASIQVTDSGGAVTFAQFGVDSLYVAPTVAVVPRSYAASVGRAPVYVDLRAYGPEATGITSWNINWGDGDTQTITNMPTSSSSTDADWVVSHSYSAAGSFTVMATATDSGGGHTAPTQSIQVTNSLYSAYSAVVVSHSPNNGLDDITIDGDAGADRFYVRWSGSDLQVFNNDTPASADDVGDPIYSEPLSQLDRLTINGGGGEDRLTVDYRNVAAVTTGTPFGVNPLIFNGGTASVPDLITLLGGSSGPNPDQINISGSIASSSIQFTPQINGSDDQTATIDATNSTVGIDMTGNDFTLEAQGGISPTVYSSSANLTSIDAASGSSVTLADYSGETRSNDIGPVFRASPLPSSSPIFNGPPIFDETGGNPIPNGGLDFTGPALTIIGADDATSHTIIVGSTTLKIDNQTLNYFPGTLVTFQPGSATTTLQVDGGLADISADVPANASLSVEASGGGNLEIDSTLHLSALTINPAGTVRMGWAGNHVLVIGSTTAQGVLTINTCNGGQNGGLLDLADNDMIVHAGSMASVYNWLSAGSDNLNWDGEPTGSGLAPASIVSSVAAADLGSEEALGSGMIGQLGAPTAGLFDNESVNNGDVVIKFTFYGDTNLDGVVNGINYWMDSPVHGTGDYVGFDNGANDAATGWTNGDFGYTGSLNGSDYTLMDNAWNREYGVAPLTLAADADFPVSSLPTTLNDGTTRIYGWQVDWGNGQSQTFSITATVANPYTSEDTTYMAAIVALDSSGTPIYRYPHMNITIMFAPPTIATATALSDSQISLAWSYSGGPVSGFNIYRSDPSTGAFSLVYTAPSTASNYTDSSLSEDTTYSYEVIADPTSGGSAPTAGSVSATTLPKAPSDLQVSGMPSGGTTFTWTNNSLVATDAYLYEITNGNWIQLSHLTLPISPGGTTSTLSLSNQELVLSSSYQYSVKAYSSLGGYSLPCSPTATTTATFPSRPTGLSAFSQYAGSGTESDYQLTWNEDASNATSIAVQSSSDGNNWTAVYTGSPSSFYPSGTSFYYDVTVSPGMAELFRIEAIGASGNVAYSESIKVSARPTTPVIVNPASAVINTVTGTTASLSALGTIPNGNDSNLIYTWVNLSDKMPVSFSPNGTNAAKNTTATFTEAGGYVLEVLIMDGSSQVTAGYVASRINVGVPPVPHSVTMNPPFIESPPFYGGFQLSAEVYDQFGKPFDSTAPAATWSVLSGPGSIGGANITGIEMVADYVEPTGSWSPTNVVYGVTIGGISAYGQFTIGTRGPDAAVYRVQVPIPGTQYPIQYYSNTIFSADTPEDAVAEALNTVSFVSNWSFSTSPDLSFNPQTFAYSGEVMFTSSQTGSVGYLGVTVIPATVGGASFSTSIPRNLGSEDLDPTPPDVGQVLVVDDGIYSDLTPADDVPDFIAGIKSTVGQSDARDPSIEYQPLYIQIPDYLDLTKVKLRIDYDGSDPTLVTGPDSFGGYSLPQNGNLRIWTSGGYEDGRDANEGGTYITPDQEFNATSLAVETNASGVYTLVAFVEAVKPSLQIGDLNVTVSMDPEGQPVESPSSDDLGTLKVTAIQDAVPRTGASTNELIKYDQFSNGQNPLNMSYQGDVSLASGFISHSVTDLTTDADGLPWGATRTWTDQPGITIEGSAQGNDWSVTDWPRIVQAGNTILVVSGTNILYFDDDINKERYFGVDGLSVQEFYGGPYTLTDSVGDVFEFSGFDPTNPADLSQGMYKRGALLSYTSADGVTATAASWDSLGNITTIVRGDDTFTYTYNSPQNQSSDPLGIEETLHQMKITRNGNVIGEVNYTYYGIGSEYGGPGDLESAMVMTLSQGVLVQSGGSYYRYEPSSDGGGKLLYAVEGRDYMLLLAAVDGESSDPQAEANTLDGPSDGVVAEFATEAFAYDSNGRAASQTIQGAGNVDASTGEPSASNASGTYTYSYSPSSDQQPVAMNEWEYKTTITRPDTNTEIVYLNYAGEVLLTNLATTPNYVTLYSYNSYGSLSMIAFPSATTPVENDSSLDNLVDPMASNQGGTYLNPSAGLVEYFGYQAEYLPGRILTSISIRNDAGTGQLLQAAYQYTFDEAYTFPYGYAGVYNPSGLGAYLPDISTTYSTATLLSGTPPTDSPGARTTVYGYAYSGAAHLESINATIPTDADVVDPGTISLQSFDAYGNPGSETDADGISTTEVYDPDTGAWIQSVDGAGDTTGETVDAYGRPTQISDPNGNVTNISYTDGVTFSTERTTPAFGPTTVVRTNWAAGYIETYTVPNGSIDGTGALLSLSVVYLDTAGRTVSTRQYYDLTGVTENSLTAGDPPSSNYYSTSDIYDPMGRLSQTTDEVGTVTKTIYTPQGWVSTVSVGGVMVTQNQYDNGDPGDGNLTQTTTFVNNTTTRTTKNYYDWRDRLYATDNGIQLTYYTLDNLGEITQTDVFDSTTANFTPNANHQPNESAEVNMNALRARTTTIFDARGRVQEQDVADVVPQYDSSGYVVGSSIDAGKVLKTVNWYDSDGRLVETDAPGGLITFNEYDAAGRVKLTETGGGEAQDGGPADLVTSTATTYDKDGNAVLMVTTNYGTNGVATRTDTVANWYDPANRLTDSVDYGINGPTSQPSSPPTSSTSTALLTHYTYNVSSGYLETTTDPNGTTTWQKDDALGRPIIVVQGGSSNLAYGTNVLTTDYQYNGANEITRQTVLDDLPTASSADDTNPNDVHSELTINTYGGTGVLDQSLLTQVQYSNNGGTENYTYDNLGEVVTYKNRSGDTHQYTYDDIGRETMDTVIGFGTATDQTIKALGTSYDTLGNVLSQTSYYDTAYTNIANQINHEYNGFSQVIADYENASGPVGSMAPSVQYAYDQGDNDSRLTGEVYPDGHVVAYGYSGSPVDDEVDRIDQTSLGTASGSGVNLVITPTSQLESDSYLGGSMIAGRALPQINVTETTTLNSLNQVNDMNWVQSRSGTTGAGLDDYSYTYDYDGEVKSRTDNSGNAATDPNLIENFGYNALGDLNSYATISSVNNGSSQTYTLDSMGNRLGSMTYDTNNQASNAAPVGGDTTNLLIGGNPDTGIFNATVTYDAWGRETEITKSRTTSTVIYGREDPLITTTVAETFKFQYDAMGRQMKETDTLLSAGTNPPVTTTITVSDANDNPVQATETYTNDGSTSSTVMYNIFSGADDRIIARETVGSKFVYALTDAQNNVTSLVDYGKMAGQSAPTWQVYERYTYNADGVATAYDVNWKPISTASTSAISAYNWTILWHGMQRVGIAAGYSLYTSLNGDGWYDPQQARSLTPGLANIYTSTDDDSSLWDYVPVAGLARRTYLDAQAGLYGTAALEGIGTIADAFLNFISFGGAGALDSTLGRVSIELSVGAAARLGTADGAAALVLGGISREATSVAGIGIGASILTVTGDGIAVGAFGRVGIASAAESGVSLELAGGSNLVVNSGVSLSLGNVARIGMTAGLLPVGPTATNIAANYQRYYNEAASAEYARFSRGQTIIPTGLPWQTVLGQRIDAIARNRLKNFLASSGIAEGPGTDVLVNRFLRDPSGSGAYRIPDLLLNNVRLALDGTIGSKTLQSLQMQQIFQFTGGFDTRLIRPALLTQWSR